MKMQMTETVRGFDKKERYSWTTKDAPGQFVLIDKNALRINDAYQRDANTAKIVQITKEWSWIACGAIIVASRSGEYWVIDGQHRVMSAIRRSDISAMPCLVFETQDVKEEAIGFLSANTNRKPISAIGKQKALVACGDPVAVMVQRTFLELGVKLKKCANHPNELQCVSWCMKAAAKNATLFREVLKLVSECSIASGDGIHERVLAGLFYIAENSESVTLEKRMVDRIKMKGIASLRKSAIKASAYYAAGGAKIWANGILDELNKGLQNRFELKFA